MKKLVIAIMCSVSIVTVQGQAYCSGYADVIAEAQRTEEAQRAAGAVIARHPELSSNDSLMQKMLSIVNHYEKQGNTRSQSILRAEGDMIRNGLLANGSDRRRQTPGGGAGVIESRVDGDFNGWDGETIVRLYNGQIWQQAQYHYEYRYAYMPKAIVFFGDGGWKMMVEGTSRAIPVSRLK